MVRLIRGRDQRVDFFRGLALLMIFIDHVPGNALSTITLQAMAFCDAAEVFVLLSGLSAGLAFVASYRRASWPAATARVLMRCWNLYVVHIVLFCVVAAVVVSATRAFNNPLYLEQINLLPLFVDTERALVFALTLHYLPDFLDILPLYVVLLAIVPVALPICIRCPWAMLGVSASLYVVVQIFPFNLPNYPGETGWFFNPFAWQFLFVIGLVIGTTRPDDWGIDPLTRRILLIGSATIVIAAFTVTAPWRQISGLEQAVIVPWSWLPPLSKTNLSILRLLDILALFYLIGSTMRPNSRLLRHAIGRLFVLLGKHSLPVFATGIIGAVLGNVVFMEVGRGMVPHVVVNAAGLLAMLGVAWVASWLKTEPWNIAKKGTQSSDVADGRRELPGALDAS